MTNQYTTSSRMPAPPIGEPAIVGATWLMLQTMISRVLLFTTHVFLARLLNPADFAAVAMAQSAVVFFSLLQPTLLCEILIQRQRHFRRWANSGFWLSIVACGGVAVVTGIIGPTASLIFHDSSIFGLVLILGATTCLNGLSVVWTAERSIQFRFRFIAFVALISSTLSCVLMVVMARYGAGPYALVLPQTIATLSVLILNISFSSFRPRWNVQLKRWRFLLADSVYLSGWAFFTMISLQADNFCLGIYHKATMGDYVWAYSLSMQFVQLVAGSLRSVLLPTFGRITEERERANEAFLQIVSIVSFLAMPICILAIPAVPAIVRLIFSVKWDGAVPYVQILLPSMGFVVVTTAAGAAMQAQRLFKRGLFVYGSIAVVFVAAVWPAAAFGGPLAVAFAVSAVYTLTAFGISLAANAPSTRSFKMHFFVATLPPFVLAAISGGVAWLCVWQIGWNPWSPLYAIVALGIGVLCYFLATLVFMRTRMWLAVERFRPVFWRLLGR